jgi:hypothetical protein
MPSVEEAAVVEPDTATNVLFPKDVEVQLEPPDGTFVCVQLVPSFE